MNYKQKLIDDILFGQSKNKTSLDYDMEVFADQTMRMVKALEDRGFTRKESVDIVKIVVANSLRG